MEIKYKDLEIRVPAWIVVVICVTLAVVVFAVTGQAQIIKDTGTLVVCLMIFLLALVASSGSKT